MKPNKKLFFFLTLSLSPSMFHSLRRAAVKFRFHQSEAKPVKRKWIRGGCFCAEGRAAFSHSVKKKYTKGLTPSRPAAVCLWCLHTVTGLSQHRGLLWRSSTSVSPVSLMRISVVKCDQWWMVTIVYYMHWHLWRFGLLIQNVINKYMMMCYFRFRSNWIVKIRVLLHCGIASFASVKYLSTSSINKYDLNVHVNTFTVLNSMYWCL